MTEWQTGLPPKHGYYLAAWKRAGRLTVSELWFNPEAIRPWWFTRAYGGERIGLDNALALNLEVVAWMPMPNPPDPSPHEKSPPSGTPLVT
jgi:hypothetical protein